MRLEFFIIICFGIFLLPDTSSALGQRPISNWANVESLKTRTRIVVESRDGTMLTGRVAIVTPDTLMLTRDGGQSVLARDNVETVHLGRRSSVFKRAFVGAGGGALIGLGAGTIATLATGEGKGLLAAQGLLYGIPAGAVIGSVTGGKLKPGRLIYRAP